MASSCNCPLCENTYDEELLLVVHLEVEHRKSELARYVVDRRDRQSTVPVGLAP